MANVQVTWKSGEVVDYEITPEATASMLAEQTPEQIEAAGRTECHIRAQDAARNYGKKHEKPENDVAVVEAQYLGFKYRGRGPSVDSGPVMVERKLAKAMEKAGLWDAFVADQGGKRIRLYDKTEE